MVEERLGGIYELEEVDKELGELISSF